MADTPNQLGLRMIVGGRVHLLRDDAGKDSAALNVISFNKYFNRRTMILPIIL